jgi:hypothetical protein
MILTISDLGTDEGWNFSKQAMGGRKFMEGPRISAIFLTTNRIVRLTTTVIEQLCMAAE